LQQNHQITKKASKRERQKIRINNKTENSEMATVVLN
jgi:hypothetical protein